MKSKTIISLILCVFFFQGLAMSQERVSAVKIQSEKELAQQAEKLQQFFVQKRDSALKLRGTGFAAPDAVWSRGQNAYFQMLDNSSRSSLSFKKEFREKNTINRSYEMQFTKENKSLGINVRAQAREGSVQIVIIKPNGKNFKVLEVEDMESLDWNHTLNAYTEENKKEYEGMWQVKVFVKNAVGNYSIRLNMK